MKFLLPVLMAAPSPFSISDLDADISSAESAGLSDLYDQDLSGEAPNIRTADGAVLWTAQVRNEKREALSRIKSSGRSADLIRVISGLATAIILLARAYISPTVVLLELSAFILINLCSTVVAVCKYIRYQSILKEFKKQAFDYPYQGREVGAGTGTIDMTPEHINALRHNTALVVETMRLREAGHDIPELSFDDPRLIQLPLS